MANLRQLPDGTWLNEDTGVVAAPKQPPMGGAEPKRAPAPPMGPAWAPFQAPDIDTDAQMLQGLPGSWQMRMPQGRNYAALGSYIDAPSYQAVGLLDRMSPMVKGIILLAGIAGIATVTVYLNKKISKK